MVFSLGTLLPSCGGQTTWGYAVRFWPDRDGLLGFAVGTQSVGRPRRGATAKVEDVCFSGSRGRLRLKEQRSIVKTGAGYPAPVCLAEQVEWSKLEGRFRAQVAEGDFLDAQTKAAVRRWDLGLAVESPICQEARCSWFHRCGVDESPRLPRGSGAAVRFG